MKASENYTYVYCYFLTPKLNALLKSTLNTNFLYSQLMQILGLIVNE